MWEIAVHLAVAGGVYDGVFLCCLFFSRDVLDGTFDLIESVPMGFLTYSLSINSTLVPASNVPSVKQSVFRLGGIIFLKRFPYI